MKDMRALHTKPHKMGRKGYAGKRKDWEEEDEKVSAEGKDNPWMQFPGRSRLYLRARSDKGIESGNITFTSPSVLALAERVKAIAAKASDEEDLQADGPSCQELHNHYMLESANGVENIGVQYDACHFETEKPDNFYDGFSDLYDLLNLDTMDVSLLRCFSFSFGNYMKTKGMKQKSKVTKLMHRTNFQDYKAPPGPIIKETYEMIREMLYNFIVKDVIQPDSAFYYCSRWLPNPGSFQDAAKKQASPIGLAELKVTGIMLSPLP
ncbi:hypothetical protein C2845_PM06G26660 [Panicum miliaceum]|uniref:Uncharacterized protein n=1 Tax=Panicum miliaceum TaxID=4540 RepID=A0A3L6R970_PANMI|nr:hypothetical protein C2845_PM06G26660 [Panicum miliaceum]